MNLIEIRSYDELINTINSITSHKKRVYLVNYMVSFLEVKQIKIGV